MKILWDWFLKGCPNPQCLFLCVNSVWFFRHLISLIMPEEKLILVASDGNEKVMFAKKFHWTKVVKIMMQKSIKTVKIITTYIISKILVFYDKKSWYLLHINKYYYIIHVSCNFVWCNNVSFCQFLPSAF